MYYRLRMQRKNYSKILERNTNRLIINNTLRDRVGK